VRVLHFSGSDAEGPGVRKLACALTAAARAKLPATTKAAELGAFAKPGCRTPRASPLFRAATILALWLMCSSPALVQTAPLPPGVQVRIEATPKSATVGDPILLDLDILMPAGYRAEVLKPGNQAGDFSVLEFFPGPSVPGPAQPQSDTNVHHRSRITAAVYGTGSFAFPPIQILIWTADGKKITASSPPVNVTIQSVLSEKDRELKDLKKQAEVPEPFPWLFWLTILLALAIVAFAAWILWKRRRKLIPASPSIPARDLLDIAEEELRALLARGVPEGRAAKQFYILLSGIVKRILEAGYGIHTSERTTSEIMDDLRSRSAPAPDALGRIESFLLRCDLVKFAKYVPSKAENEAAAEDALWILENSRQLSVASRQ